MAARKQPHALSLLLFLALSTLPCIINSANVTECVGPHDISVYWGRHSEAEEGNLMEACESRKYNYDIVILSYLLVFEANASTSPPSLQLQDHCGYSPESNNCSILAPQIKHCQDVGVKVFLSLRMAIQLRSTPRAAPPAGDDLTPELAKYLVDNFLIGDPDGPLGAVSLDGINIENYADTRLVRWDELVTLIHEWSLMNRKVYISASPTCPFDQDPYLNAAIETGYVHYVWVEFYNHHPSCIYDGTPDKLLEAWATWTSHVPESLIFLGLTANQNSEGYIEPEVVRSEILPKVKKASNYGGVMMWERFSDIGNNYTPQIKDGVPKTCKCDCGGNETASTRFKSLLARS